MDFLPLGTIVTIKQDENNAKLMIIKKLATKVENEKEVGYYDYAVCVYPHGLIGNEVYFINEDDIDKIIFRGYEDKDDAAMNAYLSQKEKELDYPHMYNKLPKYSKNNEDLTNLLNDE